MNSWWNSRTPLSDEKEKNYRPQKDLDNKKQLCQQPQHSSDSNREKDDLPLCMQASTEVDNIHECGHEARESKQQQSSRAWTSESVNAHTKRECSRASLQHGLEEFEE
jgi:hypothetical protein